MRRAQVYETLPGMPADPGAFDGSAEQVDDVVVAAEVGEVLESQIDRTGDFARGTQVAELVGLSLSAGHVTTIDLRADAWLHFD